MPLRPQFHLCHKHAGIGEPPLWHRALPLQRYNESLSFCSNQHPITLAVSASLVFNGDGIRLNGSLCLLCSCNLFPLDYSPGSSTTSQPALSTRRRLGFIFDPHLCFSAPMLSDPYSIMRRPARCCPFPWLQSDPFLTGLLTASSPASHYSLASAPSVQNAAAARSSRLSHCSHRSVRKSSFRQSIHIIIWVRMV